MVILMFTKKLTEEEKTMAEITKLVLALANGRAISNDYFSEAEARAILDWAEHTELQGMVDLVLEGKLFLDIEDGEVLFITPPKE